MAALLVATAAAAAAAAATPASAAPRFNFVFILADDLGWNNIGHHNGITRTPNIDALFTGGLTLNQSYVHKWCAPTRASLMTGRLPYHTGVEHGSLGGYDAPEQYFGLSEAWTFLPRTLKNAGYATHMLGKWNLGLWNADVYTPTGRGFDSYLGYYAADGQYYTHYKWPAYSGGKGTPANYSASLPALFNITDLANGTRYVDRNSSCTGGANNSNNVYAGVYSTYMYAEQARHIVATTPEPYFLYMAAQSIHTPLEAPQVYMDMYRDQPNAQSDPPSDAQTIHAMVTALDDLVGNITWAVKDAGQWDRTLVVFGSDNGGDTHGNNHPLRGAKFTTWEGGLRVVGAVSGGALPHACAGAVAPGLVHVADWHPTFAALAGVRVNATGPRPLDGVDVWPHIQSCGAEPSARTELLHHYDGPKQGAFREGDLKLIVGGMSPSCYHPPYPLEHGKKCKPGTGDPQPRDWSCKPCSDPAGPGPCHANGGLCLFNVTADATESHDLAGDPAMNTTVQRLLARYLELGADVCLPTIAGGCLDYINHDDQVAWVNQTLERMYIAPLPNAGPPLKPSDFQ